jgi:hypothetical protein
MNKKILFWLIAILGVAFGYFLFQLSSKTPPTVYTNTDYGFTFSLTDDWKGYSIIKSNWQGSPIAEGTATTGQKITIRNPKWTETEPYEDIPILVFTIPQWNSYIKEDFSVSAAPILASELARNNTYVFALPPRWNFDYSLGFKEAEDMIVGGALHAFDI